MTGQGKTWQSTRCSAAVIGSEVRLIALDADDTLWDCQSHFEKVEHRLCEVLAPWCGAEEAAAALFSTERSNMQQLGYGSKAFTISLMETALRMSKHRISPAVLAELVGMGKALGDMPATPLPGVESTLQQLHRQWVEQRGLQMVVFTKGELLEQEHKLMRSGLKHLFTDSFVVSNKDEDAYRLLCHRLQVEPTQLLMVGNSVKSDVAPALRIGAYAAHIPYHVVWQLECSEEFDHPRLVRLNTFSELLEQLQPLLQ